MLNNLLRKFGYELVKYRKPVEKETLTAEEIVWLQEQAYKKEQEALGRLVEDQYNGILRQIRKAATNGKDRTCVENIYEENREKLKELGCTVFYDSLDDPNCWCAHLGTWVIEFPTSDMLKKERV